MNAIYIFFSVDKCTQSSRAHEQGIVGACTPMQLLIKNIQYNIRIKVCILRLHMLGAFAE